MIKPSELLKIADESCYKHYRFYGTKPLSAYVYKRVYKENGGVATIEVDLGLIDWEDFKIESLGGRIYFYDYSKGIASLLNNANAQDVAKILDKFTYVDLFTEEDGTLWMHIKEK